MFLASLFGSKRRIRKLRKKWDRQREKTLKIKDPLKSQLLAKLDQMELNIRSLEEQNLGRVDIARLLKTVEIDLEETKAIMKNKKMYNQAQQNVKK